MSHASTDVTGVEGPGDPGVSRAGRARLRYALTTHDPVLAYHVSRGAVSLALAVAATGVMLTTRWAGAVAVIVASLFVLSDSIRRIVSNRTRGVLSLHLVDAVVIGIAVIWSDLPSLIAIGPYAYLLIGAVLLLPTHRAAVVAAWTAGWVGVTLVLSEPIRSDVLDGTVIWVATAVALSVYLSATMFLSSVAARAMRERGRLSESLRSSRARIHAIVENSGLVVFALDKAGRVTFTETSGLVTLGAPAGDVVGRSIYELIPDADELHAAVQEVLSGGEAVVRDVRFGDSAFRFRLSPELDQRGKVVGLIGIATDETERVVAAEVLSRKVEMEQLIARLSTHLIGLPPDEIEDGVELALEAVSEFIGADGAFVALSSGDGDLLRVQEYTRPGGGSLPEVTNRIGPDVFPWLYNRLAGGRLLSVSNLRAVPSEAWRLRDAWRAAGVNSVAMVPIFLFREFAGAAAVGAARENAFGDDDLVLLRFTAEMLVAVLHRKRIHTQLEQLVRSKDEFIASVSHELRTPLTTVVGLAEELQVRPDDFDETEMTEFHRLLAEQAGEVSDIVEDLLVVARADIGKVSIHPAEVDVAAEAVNVLRGFEHGGRVVTVVGHNVQPVWADPVRLRQIVRNLISNALRYGGERIEVRVLDRGGSTVLEVADDGGGLAGAAAEELFEPYRHTAQVEGRPPSIGLGLTVGRKLARIMGGDLSVETRDGWTVFRIELPSAVPRAVGFDGGTASQSVASSDVSAIATSDDVAGDELDEPDDPQVSVDVAVS